MKNNEDNGLPDVRPPNHPWKPIEQKSPNLATICFYYGDAKSLIVPIRDVSNRRDAKRDPNLETETYGLFSVCCEKERKAIVEQGITTQFFCTSRADATRVLSGYYKPAWYCQFGPGDYAIAAEKIRFVSPGFELEKIVNFLNGFRVDEYVKVRTPWRYIRDNYCFF